MNIKQQWQLLQHPLLALHEIDLWISHLVTEEPLVSGNKCLKLKYQLSLAIQHKLKGIITFGGAFSNHLVATAAACKISGIQSTGLVRTDQLDLQNPTLQACQRFGMELHPISRNEYRQRHEAELIEQLQQQYPGWLIVPEGGTSTAAVTGVAELNLEHTPGGKADLICCATASGGTLAGIISGSTKTPVTGIAVVNDSSLPDKIMALLKNPVTVNWQLNINHTDGGYARFSPDLLKFCLDLKEQCGLATEPIYTGKALRGLFKMIADGQIPPGSRLSFFHTGGLQGLAGLHYRKKITANEFALLNVTTAG